WSVGLTRPRTVGGRNGADGSNPDLGTGGGPGRLGAPARPGVCGAGPLPAPPGTPREAGTPSPYERIRQLNSAITGHAWNDAVSGAKMDDAPGQATQAVSQHARYVTILMGANDLCTSSPATMTSTGSFEADFQSTMATLMAQNPRPYVFVSSIPNIYRLWTVLKGNSLARWAWANFHICQSMLGETRTEEERQEVVAREQAFNDILAE